MLLQPPPVALVTPRSPSRAYAQTRRRTRVALTRRRKQTHTCTRAFARNRHTHTVSVAVYTETRSHMHAHARTRTHMHVRIRTHRHKHAHTRTQTHAQGCTGTRTRTRTQTHAHAHARTNALTCTHAHAPARIDHGPTLALWSSRDSTILPPGFTASVSACATCIVTCRDATKSQRHAGRATPCTGMQDAARLPMRRVRRMLAACRVPRVKVRAVQTIACRGVRYVDTRPRERWYATWLTPTDEADG
jgi:hypothetical protein